MEIPTLRITSGDMPKYRQLLIILRNQILSGQIAPGERIPSEEDLIGTYGLSRGTVRNAIAQLEAEKLIEIEHGVGSFVRALHPKAIPFRFFPASERAPVQASVPLGVGAPIQADEARYEILVQETTTAPLEIAERLKLPPGSAVIHLARRRRVGGVTVSYSERYLEQAVLPNLATEDLSGICSIHDLLVGSSDFPLLKAEVEIEAHLLNEEEARLLEATPGEPAIVVHRMTYTAPNKPAVWYYGLFRSRYELGVGVP
jgi:DNA-binding GntR family transcriptional regulator